MKVSALSVVLRPPDRVNPKLGAALAAPRIACALASLFCVALTLSGNPGAQVRAQTPASPATHGPGTVQLAPGTVAAFAFPPPEARPGAPSTPNLSPNAGVAAVNESDQTAEVTFDGSLIIQVPKGNAILLPQDPRLWTFCQYGTDALSQASAAPANQLACIGTGPANVRTVDFTTIPWSGDVPITMRVPYAAGWNLVAAPQGTGLAPVDATGAGSILTEPFFTLQAGDDTYERVQNDENLDGGVGYWAYFDTSVTVGLRSSGPRSIELPLPAGKYIMIGNPGESPVSVTGADVVYVYDATTESYREATILEPGQGAWAYSVNGGSVTLAPVSG